MGIHSDELKQTLRNIAKTYINKSDSEVRKNMYNSGYLADEIDIVMSLRGALKKEPPTPKNRARQRAARELSRSTGMKYTAALRQIDQEEAEKKAQS